MMPAAKHMDPVTGVDIHLIQPPGPVPPIPIPHPFVGMITDPFDYIPLIGSTVQVNFMHRVMAGTTGSCLPPHIPIGGTFIKPPSNECEMFMGAATVQVDGDAMSHMSLPALSCHCIGMICPPRPNPKKGTKLKSLVLPTSMILPIPAGPPVLVGGPPTISLMAMAMHAAMGLARGFRALQKGSGRVGRFFKSVSKKFHDAASNAMKKMGVPPGVQNRVHRSICTVTGHPVDVVTGKVFTDKVDLELPGPLPLSWERVYFSSSSYEGPLGHGWHHSYDLALCEDDEAIAVRLADGRPVAFPRLGQGESYFERAERLTLTREPNGYALVDSDGLRWRFAPLADTDIQPLVSVENRSGHHRISFEYDERGFLRLIRDSGGRMLPVRTDDQGRIVEIKGPHPDDDQADVVLLRYAYDRDGNLVEARDALDHPMRFVYDGHQLVQETDGNGLSFYFEYDQPGHEARCTHTWGDDGIYDHKLDYDTLLKTTHVTNSLGHTTIHHWDDSGLVTQTIDPLGNLSMTAFNEFNQPVVETDELGLETAYEYDERGNTTQIVEPDGATLTIQYDDHDRAINATDTIDGAWLWEYDDVGNLVRRVDPTGHETRFQHSDRGHLAAIIDPAGNTTSFVQDGNGNLSAVNLPDGGHSQWNYDRLGRATRASDPAGNEQRRTFDLAGRATRIEEPDGNVRNLDYDSLGNVLHVTDRQHDVRFSYQGMGRLASRTEAGTTVRFEYNTEEDLTGIVNEHGHVYQFELDAMGNVAIESGFDGIRRVYTRDAAGQVSQLERASGLLTTYAYDPAGRITQLVHSDSSQETYVYREDGELIEAANGACAVRFERDEVGRIRTEWQDDYWIRSEYDENGLRRQMQSSLGAIQSIERNSLGDVTAVRYQDAQSADPATTAWDAQITRDMLGQELERTLPGGIRSRWDRDKLGRPKRHQILQGTVATRDVQYEWDANDRLQKIVDAHHGTTVFEHDAVGNLASATYGDGTVDLRMPDAVGNLFRTEERSDRVYGPAGEILESHAEEGVTRYEYDPEGNLLRKATPQGDWIYAWNAAGMLASVQRPDGELVEFEYDPLGRRIRKTFQGQTTHWVWDGNNPLHEWVEGAANDEPAASATAASQTTAKPPLQEALVGHPPTGPPDGLEPGTAPKGLTTWLFDPESFAPAAKLVDGQRYSIVTDYLGTPTAMLDATGHTVWSADISIYGQLRNLTGDRHACPFRWPGQYEDAETGLYYNRFRYYDPEAGAYVSQDPIGLAGNNPNIYAYTKDVNIWIDPFGLDTFYQLYDSAGDLVYEGITERNVQARLTEHASDGKVFSSVRYVDDLSDRAASRNLEGSSLHHNIKNKKQLNKRRFDKGFYHSYDPENVRSGRKYLSAAEVEAKMKTGKTADVDTRGKMSNIKSCS